MKRHRGKRLLIAAVGIFAALPTGSARAAFSGVNGKIAFASTRGSGGQMDIFTMPAGGGTPVTNITNSPANDLHPAWNAAGTQIAYDYDLNYRAIRVMNADGSNQHTVASEAGKDYMYPAWSPDGTKIAFAKFWFTGNPDIMVVNADGSGLVDLTQSNFLPDTEPSWSPDGTKIAFIRQSPQNHLNVYAMKADGTSLTNITNDATDDESPEWSPDGSKIAYVKVTVSGSTVARNVWTIHADGTGRQQLTSRGSDVDPAWSPDGTAILFATSRTGDSNVWRMNTDGSSQSVLTGSTAYDGQPSWQPTHPAPPCTLHLPVLGTCLL